MKTSGAPLTVSKHIQQNTYVQGNKNESKYDQRQMTADQRGSLNAYSNILTN